VAIHDYSHFHSQTVRIPAVIFLAHGSPVCASPSRGARQSGAYYTAFARLG
jgi:hypothetical protein